MTREKLFAGRTPIAQTASAGKLTAEWWDATSCCLPGRTCWMASVVETDRPTNVVDVADCCDGENAAREWAFTALRARTGAEPRTAP